MATASTTDWAAIRITSSSSIQRAVSSSLTHLASSSSTPLVLHSSPSQRSRKPAKASSSAAQTDDVEHDDGDEIAADQLKNSSRAAINAKSNSAAIGKLVGIIEIIKRNFAEHQRALWKADDEREKRKLEKQRRKNGKKRQREDDAGHDMSVDGGAADANTSLDADAQKARDVLQRHLLRIYQYNIMDYVERTQPSKPKAGRGSDSSSGSDSESGSSDDEDNEEAGPSLAQAAPDTEETKAKRALDAAILSHVVENDKRPRKKHTPHLFCVLSTTRLPGYEKELLEEGREFTLQLPPKVARPRKRKRKGVKAGTVPDDAEGSDSTSDEDKTIAEQIIQSSHDGVEEGMQEGVPAESTETAEQQAKTFSNTNTSLGTGSTTNTPPMATAPERPVDD